MNSEASNLKIILIFDIMNTSGNQNNQEVKNTPIAANTPNRNTQSNNFNINKLENCKKKFIL